MQRLSADILFENARLQLRRERWRFAGGEVEPVVIQHPGAVVIVAQDSDGQLLMLRQFRYPLAAWIWELPAGTCLPGEDPRLTAARELREETGYSAARWQDLGWFHALPGLSDERLRIYAASDLQPGTAAPEAGEMLELHRLPVARVQELITAGELRDAKTLLALQLAGVLQLRSLPC